jgi:hypothetical protein
MTHETLCTLYRLAQVGREIEAEMGWPLTPTEDLVASLKRSLFGADDRELVGIAPR